MDMVKTALIFITVLVMTLGASAQDTGLCELPLDLKRLTDNAAEVVDVNMDANMLQFAGNFLSKENEGEAEAKKLIGNLKGICVRSFEFDSEGQYTQDDVQALRSQFSSPVWSSIVNVQSKRDKENVNVYFRTENGTITGLAVIAAEPKQLTFVHINGLIDPEQLTKLGGQFGIPKVEITPESNPLKKEESE
jgi:hypothetical protein